MKKDLSELKRVLEDFGFDETNGTYGIRPVLYFVLMIILIANSSLFVVYHWEDVDERVDGIKGLVLYFICFVYLLAYLVDWKRSVLLIKTIDEGGYKFPYKHTKKRSGLEESLQNGMTQLNTIWYYGCIGYATVEIATSVLVFVLQMILHNSNDITVEMLYLPEPFYFPKNHKTMPMYFTAFILQALFFLHTRMNSYCILVSSFISMQLVEGEIKLLRLSLDEMDYIVRSQRVNNSKTTDDILQEFCTYIIKHHHDICRKARNVSKGVPLVAMSINSGMSILLCTSIYIVVKSDDVMLKIPEGCYCCLVLFTLYCCDLMGERISNEDENLRRTLYECSWVDKPKWFKRSLQIVMARTNRTIEIKSVGLFALNLRNFSMTVRTAYSFYNLLNNFKN